MAAPWVAMFAVLAQMHQRYLMWGAALTCMAVAVSPGLVVVHLLLSAISAGQEMVRMVEVNHQPQTPWSRIVDGYTPGMGWAVMAIAVLLVYLSAAGKRRGRERPVRPA